MEPRSQADCPPGKLFRRGYTTQKGVQHRATCYTPPQSQPKSKDWEPRGPQDCPEGTYFRKSSMDKNGVYRRATCVRKATKSSAPVSPRRSSSSPMQIFCEPMHISPPSLAHRKSALEIYLEENYKLDDFVEDRYNVLDAATVVEPAPFEQYYTCEQYYTFEDVIKVLQRMDRSSSIDRAIIDSDIDYLMLQQNLSDDYNYWWNRDEGNDYILDKMVREVGLDQVLEWLEDLAEFRNQDRDIKEAVLADIGYLYNRY